VCVYLEKALLKHLLANEKEIKLTQEEMLEFHDDHQTALFAQPVSPPAAVVSEQAEMKRLAQEEVHQQEEITRLQ